MVPRNVFLDPVILSLGIANITIHRAPGISVPSFERKDRDISPGAVLGKVPQLMEPAVQRRFGGKNQTASPRFRELEVHRCFECCTPPKRSARSTRYIAHFVLVGVISLVPSWSIGTNLWLVVDSASSSGLVSINVAIGLPLSGTFIDLTVIPNLYLLLGVDIRPNSVSFVQQNFGNCLTTV
ncbi:hypothetical protein C8R44DRAFT_807327 [Mycena epipterygia]|nr:hypothetical protein C8R44DRAFT_807327 [Mycena epipterygia]